MAPGRIFLGIGTGHTAMRVMGQDPMGVAEFRDYLRVVRDDAAKARRRRLHLSRQAPPTSPGRCTARAFATSKPRFPIYVAANGPRALRAAGTYGDGLVSIFNEQPDVLD
jgi:5,10-methylenetetrahydromethanopterin reductase